MSNVALKDYYIAYFDILGYKAFFADKGNDVFEFLQANVNMANDIVRKTSPDAVFSNMQFEVKKLLGQFYDTDSQNTSNDRVSSNKSTCLFDGIVSA